MCRYLSDLQLAKRYSVSRSTIWRWAQRGVIPHPKQLSQGCTRWRLDEIESCDAARDGTSA